MVRGPDGDEVGRGLIAYDAADAEKIKGRSSADILLILGFTGRTEMIHRDDLVLRRRMTGAGQLAETAADIILRPPLVAPR